MDELKKFISENRSLFDTNEPQSGHEQRFLQKLNVQNNPKKTFAWSNLLKVAVVSILIVLSGLYVKDKIFYTLYNKTAEIIKPENKEFVETKQYYIQQIDMQIQQINENKVLTPEQQKIFVNEIKNVDELYKQLQKDLKAMPDDPRIMQKIIQHYKIKLQILNRIVKDLNNLDNIKQLNTKNNEKINL